MVAYFLNSSFGNIVYVVSWVKCRYLFEFKISKIKPVKKKPRFRAGAVILSVN
jgi:hypothetical protein